MGGAGGSEFRAGTEADNMFQRVGRNGMKEAHIRRPVRPRPGSAKAVALLSKKGHSHHNMIRSQRRYYRWLAFFFTLHFTHSFQATPFFECHKELSERSLFRLVDRSRVEGWREVCTLRLDQELPSEDGNINNLCYEYIILNENVTQEGLLVAIAWNTQCSQYLSITTSWEWRVFIFNKNI